MDLQGGILMFSNIVSSQWFYGQNLHHFQSSDVTGIYKCHKQKDCAMTLEYETQMPSRMHNFDRSKLLHDIQTLRVLVDKQAQLNNNYLKDNEECIMLNTQYMKILLGSHAFQG